ncbi:hypothetical protein A4R29_04830 [Mesorhizobium ciceri biovar biserrulae]|nr:hypothetical protein A4R29_04830 [Mesorhizobium ciceri biovar biserrulae]
MHRCLQRATASADCPDVEGDRPAKKKFKDCPIGYRPNLEVRLRRTAREGSDSHFQRVSAAPDRGRPYRIHTVLTDNGIRFTTPGGGGSAVPLIKEAIANGEIFGAHAFE